MSVVTSNIIPSSKSSLNPKHHRPSFSLWCGDSHTSQHAHPPFNFLFWAKHCRGDDLCLWKHDVSITSKARETKSCRHQTNTPISHCTAFSRASHRGWRRACLLWSISHCKGKGNLPPGPFNWHGNKRTTVQSITINTDQRAPNGLVFLDAPCGTSFFLTGPSHSIFPHS